MTETSSRALGFAVLGATFVFVVLSSPGLPLGIGMLAVAGIIGYLLYRAVRPTD